MGLLSRNKTLISSNREIAVTVAVLSAALIVARRIWRPDLSVGQQLTIDYAAILALFVLAILLVDAAISFVLESESREYHRLFYMGAAFGLISGLVGGIYYAFFPGAEGSDGAADIVARLTRVVVISIFVNGFLHLTEQIFLTRHSLGSRRREAFVVLLFAVFGIVILTFIVGVMPGNFGAAVSTLTLGLVDWIGTGTCEPWTVGNVPHECPLGILRAVQIILIVGVSAGLTLIYYSTTVRLSGRRIALAAGALGALLAVTLLFLHQSGTADQRLPLENPILAIVLGAMWVAYVASFVQILGWSRYKALVEALVDAFVDLNSFSEMLRVRLGKYPAQFSSSENLEDVVAAVVDSARAQNWLEALIVNARYSRPDHAALAAIADRAGVGVAPPDAANINRTAKFLGIRTADTPQAKLEKIIRKTTDFEDGASWRSRMAEIERCVCRVETSRSLGTGFLVAPDLVLTNYHVVAGEIEQAQQLKAEGKSANLAWEKTGCRFDYKATPLGQVNPGVFYALHSETPCIASAPPSEYDLAQGAGSPAPNELDYAVLRLANPAGLEPLGLNSEPGAPRRGWVNLSTVGSRSDWENEIVWILQHPQGGPLKQDLGRITLVVGNGLRLRHDANTLEGSSGSPCFSARDLSPMALHHLGVGWPSRPGSLYNQAISLKCIVEWLETNATEPKFWNPPSAG